MKFKLPCETLTKQGKRPCRAPGIVMKNGRIRCKVHGGYSTGPKTKKVKQDLPIILLNIMTKELVINDKLTNKICTELMNGIPLARLARQKDMPSLTRIYKEITNNKSFLERINEARRIGAQTYIENAMDELEHADNRNIMIVREKVGLAKWLASKLIPVYGDRQEVKTDTTIEIKWNTNDKNVVDVTPDDVEVGIIKDK